MSFTALYAMLKHTHVTLVVISLVLFVWRGYLAVHGRYRTTRLRNLLIHGVDTLLLLCGVSLAVLLAMNPLHTPWLFAKIVALVAYVLVAAIAVRRGKTLRQRQVAWYLALAIFLYMVSVAITKNPLPFIAL